MNINDSNLAHTFDARLASVDALNDSDLLAFADVIDSPDLNPAIRTTWLVPTALVLSRRGLELPA